MTIDRGDIRRRQLRRFMVARGLKPKPWAEAAGIHPNTLYHFLKGETQSLQQDTIEALATAAGVHPSIIFSEGAVPLASSTTSITVVGTAEADVWVESMEWPPEKRFTFSLPDQERFSNGVYGLMVRGESMNDEYPDGSIVFVVDIDDYKEKLVNGDHVVCQRRDSDGQIETTIKELVFDATGAAWLWPRSKDPRHQQPLAIPASGLLGQPLTAALTLRISGFVVGALVTRARR